MSQFAKNERQGLCDTFERVGPDAPTLCSPWQTRDLAAHLVVRDRRPDAAIGMAVPALAGRLDRIQKAYAAWEWPRLIQEVRSCPPAWSLASLGPVDEAINVAEFFVHHEDVLRGGPDWTARELPRDLESALWALVRRGARIRHAKAAVGILLVAPSFGERQAHAKTDLGSVVITGAPGDLLLYAMGRKGVAQVDISGTEEALAALQPAGLGNTPAASTQS
jgi:uncharacterized protein (TIGR03085 family)